MQQTATRTVAKTKTISRNVETCTVETRAAIKEGKAMLRGDIPCKWMTTEELLKDLHG